MAGMVVTTATAASPEIEPPRAADVVAAEAKEHETTGTVTAVDSDAARITVAHDPVPTLGWPAMTMQFPVADAELLNDVTVGDKIHFVFIQDDSGKYVIQEIHKQ